MKSTAPGRPPVHLAARTIALLLVLQLLLSLALPVSGAYAQAAKKLPALEGPEYDSAHPENLLSSQLYAEAAILIDATSGRVLFEKDADKQMFPASTTKIMTLILGIEHGHLNNTITIPEEAANIPSDSSLVPVQVGEKWKYIDLLYAFMMHSGNDGANAIAMVVDGSLEKFVARMNKRAKEYGMTGTHYKNAHGHKDPDHYTTARDMAILAREGMKNELFREIVATRKYTVPPSNLREEPLQVTSRNQFVMRSAKSAPYMYEYGTGIKTGYTRDAGRCFVGSATKDGVNLISVVLKSTVDFSSAMWMDSTKLMDYGFSGFERFTFEELYKQRPITANVKNAAKDDPSEGMLALNVRGIQDIEYSVLGRAEDQPQILDNFAKAMSVEYSAPLQAPIFMGTHVGTLTFRPEDGSGPITATLTASRDVLAMPDPPPSLSDIITELMPEFTPMRFSVLGLELEMPRMAAIAAGILAGLVILLLIVRSINLSIRRRRRARRRRAQAMRGSSRSKSRRIEG